MYATYYSLWEQKKAIESEFRGLGAAVQRAKGLGLVLRLAAERRLVEAHRVKQAKYAEISQQYGDLDNKLAELKRVIQESRDALERR